MVADYALDSPGWMEIQGPRQSATYHRTDFRGTQGTSHHPPDLPGE